MQRAEDKQQILASVDSRLSSQPVTISELETPQIYTPVRLLGVYTDDYFYLDNRTRNGRVGYEILQVFETGSSETGKARWLVNRGWLPAGSDRTRLPDVAYPLAAKTITGFMYPNAEAPGETQGTEPLDPHARIQSLDASISKPLALQYPQWHIRLSADSDTALRTDWQLITTNPQKHRGYAVQWFAMAAALFVLWLLAATSTGQLVREKWFKKSTEQT